MARALQVESRVRVMVTARYLWSLRCFGVVSDTALYDRRRVPHIIGGRREIVVCYGIGSAPTVVILCTVS